MNAEIIKEFQTEVLKISSEVSNKLDGAKNNSAEYEGCGQAIDRIYGTAATLGFNEIANYAKALKESCYMGSASTSADGHKKLNNQITKFIEIAESVCSSMVEQDQQKVAEVHKLIITCTKQAYDLASNEFNGINKISIQK